MNVRLRQLSLLASLGAALAAGAWAADPPGRVAPVTGTARADAGGNLNWLTLTEVQRQRLAPLQAEWASIDDARRRKWLEVAARLPTLPMVEQDRVRERMAAWARKTPTERGRTRLQFQESLRFSPDSQDRQSRWEAYQALPAEQRQALVERALPTSTATDSTRAAIGSPAVATGVKLNTVVPAVHVGATTRETTTPTAVQARPGATTTLMSTRPLPPMHNQPGLPKIAATPNFVDPATMLPLRGPQGAATLTEPPVEADPIP